MNEIITLGVDIGSTASKCVLMKNGNEIIGEEVVFIGAGTEGPMTAFNNVCKKANINKDDIVFIVATGYGRNTFETADDQISELSCHAKGGTFLFPNVKTIIDIGGQDAKVLKVDPNGKMTSFLMNDKCAAGTGRFLEVMARVLNIPLENFTEMALASTKKIEISSTCTVFAETEVISYLAKAVKREDILAAVHRSIASRVGNLARRAGVEEDCILTGGVAHDKGIVQALEEYLGIKIQTSKYCQVNGAIGAALYGYQIYFKEKGL
jgi:predicted CoA-substrate-specific enzyme activase